MPEAGDKEIYHSIKHFHQAGDLVVGIDAPLSYNPGGGDRPFDSDLRKKIVAAGLKSGSVMTPTMTRMAYLTLRGISVARMLLTISKKIKIVEVHPGATLALRGASIKDVLSFKKSGRSRRNLLRWLEDQGLRNIGTFKGPTDHYVAACACALAAWKWHEQKSVWLQKASPPFHPFDFAC